MVSDWCTDCCTCRYRYQHFWWYQQHFPKLVWILKQLCNAASCDLHTPAFIPLWSFFCPLSSSLLFQTWFPLIYSPPPVKSNFASIIVSHAGSRLLQQAVHYLIACVCVCACVPAWISVPLFCLFTWMNESAEACMCVQLCASVFMFSFTWADGCGCVSEIHCTCRALVLCLQAKSSCCWSHVSCLCHDTKLIFYQLPSSLGKGRHGGLAWDEGMCERRQETGVNNSKLWGKFKKPTSCWILSFIPEESRILHTPCPQAWQSSEPWWQRHSSVSVRLRVCVCH